MLLRLFLLFTAVPLIELYLLLRLLTYIGALATIGVVIATGIAGGLPARSQGLAVLHQVHWELSEGRIPAESLFDGLLILLAGAMLITLEP
ncbi:FxsA family protein [Acidobacteria bacterium AH-259-O06]|nr:FxsA family protein [Acidobacteria bacterium AH-259-O06]